MCWLNPRYINIHFDVMLTIHFKSCYGPRSVNKSEVECLHSGFWVKLPTLPWRSRSMTLIFNTKQENPCMCTWCKRCDSNSKTLQVFVRTRQISWSQNGQNGLKGHGQWSPFPLPAKTRRAQTCNENVLKTRFQDVQTLTQKTSITLCWGRLKD